MNLTEFDRHCSVIYTYGSPEERQASSVRLMAWLALLGSGGATSSALSPVSAGGNGATSHTPTTECMFAACQLLRETHRQPYSQLFLLEYLRGGMKSGNGGNGAAMMAATADNDVMAASTTSTTTTYQTIHDLVWDAYTDRLPDRALLSPLAKLFAQFLQLAYSSIGAEFISRFEQMCSRDERHAQAMMSMMCVLVDEMCHGEEQHKRRSNKRASTWFKDKVLLSVVGDALKFLELLLSEQPPATETLATVQSTLNLIVSCFSVDFLGTYFFDSDIDGFVVQVPSTWRVFFGADHRALQLMMSVHRGYPRSVADRALACLSLLASVRSSIFVKAETRDEYYMQLITFTEQAMVALVRHDAQLEADDEQSCFELCRLINRLMCVAKVHNIILFPTLKSFVERLSDFSRRLFAREQWYDNAVLLLLDAWVEIGARILYHDTSSYNELKPPLTGTLALFIDRVIEHQFLNVLEDGTLLEGVQERLNAVCRVDYSMFGRHLLARLKHLSAAHSHPICIYLCSAVVSPKSGASYERDVPEVDAELTGIIFQLSATQQLQSTQDGQRTRVVELATVDYITSFWRSYLEHSSSSIDLILPAMTSLFGLDTAEHVVDAILNKLFVNLQTWTSDAPVIEKTLEVLGMICNGYDTLKRVHKSAVVQTALAQHWMYFQGTNAPVAAVSKFYVIMTRLVLASTDDDTFIAEEFSVFLKPIAEAVQRDLTPVEAEVVLRVLRAVCSCMRSSDQYSAFFDWARPRVYQLMMNTMSKQPTDSCVLAALKFFTEFATNNARRISFGLNSPNGLLLFRDTSQLLVTIVGSLHLASLKPEPRAKYVERVLNMATALVSGGYVNFGVMNVYGDNTVQALLSAVIDFAATLDISEVLEFTKLGRAYFVFMEKAIAQYPDVVPRTASLDRLLGTLTNGVSSSDILMLNATTRCLDMLATHVITQIKSSASDDQFVERYRTHRGTWASMLAVHGDLLQDDEIWWTLSRSLFPLAILVPDQFEILLNNYQPNGSVNNPKLERAINELRELISTNTTNGASPSPLSIDLSMKARDQFTQHLDTFRQETSTVLVQTPPNIG